MLTSFLNLLIRRSHTFLFAVGLESVMLSATFRTCCRIKPKWVGSRSTNTVPLMNSSLASAFRTLAFRTSFIWRVDRKVKNSLPPTLSVTTPSPSPCRVIRLCSTASFSMLFVAKGSSFSATEEYCRLLARGFVRKKNEGRWISCVLL
eukprot:scaffold8515_cov59-Cylindrotheca_fusiformis.AAC.1